MFRSFFHDLLQTVLRCALCRYYSSRWFAFVEFVLLRSMWPHVYVICVCLVFLSVGDLLVNWQYVAACVCHLCVFGVFVCWWFTCELTVCGRMCMSSVRVWCFCLFVIYLWTDTMWPHVYVICACLVFLSVGDLLVNWEYVAACVCHLCVFGVFVCLWSTCELTVCGRMCMSSVRIWCFCLLVIYLWTESMWPHVYVICACLVFLSVGDLLVNWQYVAACVCHLCVFGVFVCLWSTCELTLCGRMCMSSVRVWCSCPLVICLWTDSIWPHVYDICACLVFFSVGDLLVNWQYVATCLCHLCVFGVLVCWWSACQLTVCGRMCMSSVRVWCSCLLVICLWTDSMWPHVYVICACLVFLSVGDLLVNWQYVAACVCHLCVFGVLVCWWSACELSSCTLLVISIRFFLPSLMNYFGLSLNKVQLCRTIYYSIVPWLLNTFTAILSPIIRNF